MQGFFLSLCCGAIIMIMGGSIVSLVIVMGQCSFKLILGSGFSFRSLLLDHSRLEKLNSFSFSSFRMLRTLYNSAIYGYDKFIFPSQPRILVSCN